MSNTPTTIRRHRARRIAGLATAGVVGLAAAAAIPALAAERDNDGSSATADTVSVADTSVTVPAPTPYTAEQIAGLQALIEATPEQLERLAVMTPEEYAAFAAVNAMSPEDLEVFTQYAALATVAAMTPEELAEFVKFIAPPPPPKPAYSATVSGGSSAGSPGGFLACVRNRESGGNYGVVNGSSGAGGAYQFLPSSWQALGFASRFGVSRAELATPAQQDQAAAETYARMGRSPWAGPGC